MSSRGSASASLSGHVLGGRYRLLRPLGTGGSSTVWLAADDVLVRPVAVKILHPELAADAHFLKRFRAEARTAAALRHPHVMGVYDWGQGDEGPYLVMEHLEGGSLRSLLATGYRCSPAQTLLIGLEAARGLANAHRRGVVHRDIKPANLLFAEDTRVCVADLGLARAVAEASNSSTRGGIEGTIRYTSPEQAQGHRLDGRSDIYSLGLCLLEAATGQVPFEAETVAGTLAARVGNQLVAPASLGPLGRVIEAACRPEVADRLDAPGLARALSAAAAHYDPPERLPLERLGLVHRVAPDELITEGTAEYHLSVAGAGAAAGVAPSDRATGPPEDRGSGRAHDAGAPRGRRIEAGDGPGADRRAGDPRVDSDGPVGIRRRAQPAPAAESRPAPPRPRHRAGSRPDDTVVVPDPGEVTSAGHVARPTELGDEVVLHRPGHRRASWEDHDITIVADPATVTAAPLGAAPTTRESLDIADDAEAAQEPGHFPATRSEIRHADPSEAGDRGDGPAGESRRPLLIGAVLLLVVVIGGSLWWFQPWLPLRDVAPVTGQAEPDATNRLHNDGWRVIIKRRTSENVAAGTVIDVQPTRARQGAKVDVVVSAGPEPRTVPDLAGRPLDEASRQLAQVGLQVSARHTFDAAVPAGSVIGTDPPIGSQLARGSTVTVIVSDGPTPVAVPDVAKQTPEEARTALEAAGFKVELREAFSDDIPVGKVASTTPEAAAAVQPGATVTVNVSKGPDIVTVPSVTGKSPTQAEAALRSAGLRVSGLNGPPSGTVTGSSPAVGAKVKRGSAVALTAR